MASNGCSSVKCRTLAQWFPADQAGKDKPIATGGGSTVEHGDLVPASSAPAATLAGVSQNPQFTVEQARAAGERIGIDWSTSRSMSMSFGSGWTSNSSTALVIQRRT